MYVYFTAFQLLPDDVHVVDGKLIGIDNNAIIIKTKQSTETYATTLTDLSDMMLEMCTCTIINMRVVSIECIKSDKSTTGK